MFRPSLSNEERVRLKIALYLNQRINSNELRVHDQLPSANDLAHRFHVNRNVARGALDVLRARGLIYARQGKGFFVAPEQRSVDYLQDADVGFSETFADSGYDYQSHLLSWQLLEANDAQADALGIDVGDMLYDLKVVRWVTGSPLAVCHSKVPAHLVPQFDTYLGAQAQQFFSLNEVLRDAYGFTHPVCRSIDIDAAPPTADDVELLQITTGIPILRQTSVFEISGLGAIEFFTVHARADRFIMHLRY